ncbi:S8 family peptidase [Marinobacter shengliensis]|uniref:S8 family peptidase n=1 Tax=Marinobacter shengliensis TaxID=1389223 RepID=UPI0035BB44EA
MLFNRHSLALVALSLTFVASADEAPRKLLQNSPTEPNEESVSLVVRYGTDQISAQSVEATRQRVEVVSIPKSDAEAYAAFLKQSPGVLSVEPNYPVSNPRMPSPPITIAPGVTSAQSITNAPNDPAFIDQYAWQPPTQQYPGVHDILEAVKKSPQKRKVRIGVTDSGFHQVSDLVFDGGYNFSTIDGPGLDFYTPQIDPSCTDSHGTAVAGIIAATTNNFEGVAGIVDAELYAARVMSCGSGFLHDLATGIYWLSGQTTGSAPTLSEPVDIINVSMGATTASCPQYLQDAVNYAASKGTLVVVAAGNESLDVSNFTPANCDKVITVGSVGRSGTPSDFSNYGNGIDVAALGELVRTLNGNGDPSLWFGTSFAAPNVAGVAGLLTQQAPGLSLEQTVMRIKESVRYPEIFDTGTFRGGILDANQLVTRFKTEIAEANPEFKPVLAAQERCHRTAYQNTSPVPSELAEVYELKADGSLLDAADDFFTVFQFKNGQSMANAQQIASTRESTFLIQQVDSNNNYVFDVCQQNGSVCKYGKSIVLDIEGSGMSASTCDK